ESGTNVRDHGDEARAPARLRYLRGRDDTEAAAPGYYGRWRPSRRLYTGFQVRFRAELLHQAAGHERWLRHGGGPGDGAGGRLHGDAAERRLQSQFARAPARVESPGRALGLSRNMGPTQSRATG